MKRRRGKGSSKKKLFIFVIFLLLITTSALFLYVSFIRGNNQFISPLAESGNTAVDRMGELLDSSGIEFSSIIPQMDSSYMIRLKNDAEIILSLKKDIEEQIASLQAVVKQLTIEGKEFSRIDFRFDKPFVEIRE